MVILFAGDSTKPNDTLYNYYDKKNRLIKQINNKSESTFNYEKYDNHKDTVINKDRREIYNNDNRIIWIEAIDTLKTPFGPLEYKYLDNGKIDEIIVYKYRNWNELINDPINLITKFKYSKNNELLISIERIYDEYGQQK